MAPETVMGLPSTVTGAQAALASLRHGPFARRRCAQPAVAPGMTWFSITAVPVDEAGATTALERFLCAASGASAVVVLHRPASSTPVNAPGAGGGAIIPPPSAGCGIAQHFTPARDRAGLQSGVRIG